MKGYDFTDGVRKIFESARAESARLNHEYIGTEHLLLGLLSDDDAIVAGVFDEFEVDRNELRKSVEQIVKRGKSQNNTERLPFTNRAQQAIELAMTEARDMRDTYVGAEHLLMGLIREEKGIGGQLLIDAGLWGEITRNRIRLLHGKQSFPHKASAVRSVAVSVSYADGSTIDMNFPSVAKAVQFLSQ